MSDHRVLQQALAKQGPAPYQPPHAHAHPYLHPYAVLVTTGSGQAYSNSCSVKMCYPANGSPTACKHPLGAAHRRHHSRPPRTGKTCDWTQGDLPSAPCPCLQLALPTQGLTCSPGYSFGFCSMRSALRTEGACRADTVQWTPDPLLLAQVPVRACICTSRSSSRIHSSVLCPVDSSELSHLAKAGNGLSK